MNDILLKLEELTINASQIDKDLFDTYNVKRGLRNQDGTGVLVGLTKIGDVVGYEKKEDKIIPCDGRLYYRGIEITDLVSGYQKDDRHGFDETVYLLLTGSLPTEENLNIFSSYLIGHRDLPNSFVNLILSFRGKNIMNMLARSVLAMYTQDDDAENYTHLNLLRQSLNLISKFPIIAAYIYFSFRHTYQRKSLVFRHPDPALSTAENFLYMLKGEERYSKLEADILDLSMVLHAEHGGGNNSTFATRVISSAGTDTYSAIAAGLGSLKGYLHGGANLQVEEMMRDIKKNVKDWKDQDEILEYLLKILRGDAGDGSGKIYGIGHAVYTLSDPRAVLLKEKAKELADSKGKRDEYDLYESVEKLAPEAFARFKGENSKVVSANVDFYSGFVYKCIDIPKELFTPIFAISRMAGWCAHRLEEVTFSSRRIIRPAYRNVFGRLEYESLEERK